MKTKLLSITLLCILVFLFQGCDKNEDAPLRIALSKGSPVNSYQNYYNWIHAIDSTVIVREMYAMPLDSALELFKECSGLLLTGGTDVNPAFYGKAYDTVRCWPIDHRLDQLEMTLIDSAIAWGMPILGICRGHQMLNVALGGSLIVDIPSDFDTIITHKCENSQHCFHTVSVDSMSFLHDITGITSGEVNSNHHQAAEVMAPQLKAVAFTQDGLIEAEEWKDPSGKSFLLGVQWHPERMELSNPLSGAVGKRFIKECRGFEGR